MNTRDWSSALTVCPFCGCGCGLYLQQVSDELTGVMPSENHPVSGGRLCARGWAAHEASLWGTRLTRPLVRNGRTLEPTTWRAAIDLAAERVKKMLEDGKPIGVLGSGRATNEENFLAVMLARGILGTGHIDSCFRAPYHALVSGASEFGAGFAPRSVLQDLEQCKTILLLEVDLALTHPRVASAIMRAVRCGARLVTLGTLTTQMSHLASLHLPLFPGDELALAARLADILENTPRKNASAGSGDERGAGGPERHDGYLLKTAQLRTAVEWYAESSSAAIVLAPTCPATSHLRKVGSCFAELAVATGHRDNPGSVFLTLASRANTRGALEMGAVPTCLPGPSALEDDRSRKNLRDVWGREPTTERGLDIEAMLAEVRGLIVFADDPPAALPSAKAAKSALAELDCLIVFDAFVTPTVLTSDIALPVSSPAESFGTYTSMEGRVQRLQGCTPPPGEARPGWLVLSEFAAALGLYKPYQSAADVFRDIAAVVPRYGHSIAAADVVVEGSTNPPPANSGYQHTRGEESRAASELALKALPAEMKDSNASPDFPFWLVRVGSFDWGDDILVSSSPTLRRDHRSLRKLYPDGAVEMNARDAQMLGIRSGWRVKLVAVEGEVVVPVRLRDDIESGLLLVQFGFRDQLEPVLNGEIIAAVKVERT